MTRFAAIDLSSYPIEDVLEVLDFESYLATDKADFLSRWETLRVARPDLPIIDTAALDIETNTVNVTLQTGAARYMLALGRYNDRVRQATLAGARGRALDHIGITYYRTPRLLVAPADPFTGTSALWEDDEVYRQRLALSPESWSTCGPEGAYLFWGLSASGDVLDLAAYSEEDGLGPIAPEVRVAVLSRASADGAASATLLDTVRRKLSARDIRPLGDLVSVSSAVPLAFDVHLTLRHAPGAAPEMLRAAADAKVRAYTSGIQRWIGGDTKGPVWLVGRRIRQDTIAAAGMVPGVVEVVVDQPSSDVNVPDALAAPGSAAATAHLFRAPRVGTITVATEIMTGWM